MTTLPHPQPAQLVHAEQEHELRSHDPEQLACSLILAAQCDVLFFAGIMCRYCGHAANHGHATTCPLPDQTETRRPLDVALPGGLRDPLPEAAAHAIETITGITLPTHQLGAVPAARCVLRRWARRRATT